MANEDWKRRRILGQAAHHSNPLGKHNYKSRGLDFKEIKSIYEEKIGRKCTKREENTMFVNYIRCILGLDLIPRVYQKGDDK